LIVRIVGERLPGTTCGPHSAIRVGVQVLDQVESLFPGDAASAVWEVEVRTVDNDGKMAVRGPAVHGKGDERFLYLAWLGTTDGVDGMFRRAKLQFDAVPDALLRGPMLVGTLSLTDAKGQPTCASVRPPRIRWTAG
jgi:hypothetical protein